MAWRMIILDGLGAFILMIIIIYIFCLAFILESSVYDLVYLACVGKADTHKMSA